MAALFFWAKTANLQAQTLPCIETNGVKYLHTAQC
jgi:hypothetical protein